MSSSHRLILVLGGSLAVSALHAEDTTTPPFSPSSPVVQQAAPPPSSPAEPTASVPVATCSTLIVTADRQEEPIDATTATTSVVSAARMREEGFATNPADYLRLVPGVDLVDANGGIDGGTEQVRLRGSAAQSDTEFLLDGIPILDVTTTNGSPSLALFTQPGLTSIEVVRGSQSGLYGSHAVGGVVNFLTARPTADPRGDGEIEYGSFDTVRISGSATGPLAGSAHTGLGRPTLGIALGIDGIDSRSFATQTRSSDGNPKGFSNDPIHKIGANGRIELRPNDELLAYVSALYSNVDQAYSGFSDPNEPDFHREQLWRLGAGAALEMPGALHAQLDYAHTRSIRDEASISNLDSQYTGNDDFVGAKVSDVLFDQLALAIGVDGDHQAAITQSLNHESQNVEGAYLKGSWSAGAEGLEVIDAVVRHDHTSRHGDATTYRLGLTVFPLRENHAVRLHANVGTAFRAPSLDEQFGVYTFPFGSFVGNPNLLPQTNRSWEAGVELRPSAVVQLSSTYFSTAYHRRIVSVFDPTFTNGTLVNESSDSSIRGLENEFAWDNPSRALGVHALYTWQRTHDDNGNRFVLLPSRKASLEVITRRWGGWFLLGVDAIGARSASDGSNLPGYATLHAGIGCRITDHVTLYARGENLLNHGYVSDHYSGNDPVSGATVEFYYTGMPRSGFVGLEGQF